MDPDDRAGVSKGGGAMSSQANALKNRLLVTRFLLLCCWLLAPQLVGSLLLTGKTLGDASVNTHLEERTGQAT